MAPRYTKIGENDQYSSGWSLTLIAISFVQTVFNNAAAVAGDSDAKKGLLFTAALLAFIGCILKGCWGWTSKLEGGGSTYVLVGIMGLIKCGLSLTAAILHVQDQDKSKDAVTTLAVIAGIIAVFNGVVQAFWKEYLS